MNSMKYCKIYIKEVNDMDEKRRAERLELISKIQIKRLDNHHSEEVPIDVFNLSKRGIGFTCSMELPKGSMYEGELTIWTKEVIHVFMEIVRKDHTIHLTIL